MVVSRFFALFALSRSRATVLSREISAFLAVLGKIEEKKKTVLAERAGAICPYGFMKGSYELVAATFDGRVGDLRKFIDTKALRGLPLMRGRAPLQCWYKVCTLLTGAAGRW